MKSSRQEKRLIKRLKQRDEQAFREFVEDNQDRVFNLIYRIIGDWEEARDLSQEVFVSAFKTLDGFRGKSLLSTWLYRIAANHAKNRLKYLSRRAREKTDSLDSVPEGALNEFFQQQISRPDEQAIGHELEMIVQKALIQLDEDYRIILILRDVEHLTYEEIGAITNLTMGTVKSRLHRARAALSIAYKRLTQESLKP